ncbi:serine/threonine-protein kinase pim-2-like [Erpetoichthys calabaricus]|nr:serine/threonine-protein kinase pim-2-like [Erpetoichthys calabaricus]
MAVEYIHSKNVIHQDLKPANILIEGSSKKAYLTDWGLANVRDSVSLRQGSKISGLLSGPLGGTAIYTAPECLLTYQPCSVHSDIWSIGITFLELYTNTVPWSVKTCKELCQLMSTEAAPNALNKFDSLCTQLICTCLKYTPSERISASNLVLLLKSLDNTDLKKHYGYHW